MEINITNTELDQLLEVLLKEIESLGKEIHRTDALTFKHELEQRESKLKEIVSKLHDSRQDSPAA